MVFEYLRKKKRLEKLVKKTAQFFYQVHLMDVPEFRSKKNVQIKNPFPDVVFTPSIRGIDHVGCLTLKLFRDIGLWLSIHRW